ncbi:MAG: 50S ribosomal protein L4 [Endomicrobiia bacterium]|jgi:large subunit ribosomal protein L4|nr:50S ribosomal protein L4 [Endomicrobiaceae bacterium]MDD3053689.1 50S ribosomal protein L4 [Endomicrobiaceae bacterium]MDD3922728.1 50S ribosomal protein L4 [Endomicrobiaceae bacterium]MDD5102313.1 50S ribosomal protein L4 [Endomicrobiaceae bacterium]
MDTIVYTVEGKEKGRYELPVFFNTEVSKSLLHEITTGYLANLRSGTHSTKTRGEVSFSGAKPWKQKGTGNARAGQRNSPLWRKGGIIFGPQPRDYYQKMSKQKRRLALSMAFSILAQDNNLVLVDLINIEQPKTKNIVAFLKNLKVDGQKVIIALAKKNDVIKVASKNIPNVIVEYIGNLNAYQVMWANKIVTTPEAIDSIKEKQLV